MNEQERDLIAQFVARVASAGAPSSTAVSPTTALPPIDPQADAWIEENFRSHPTARYRVTQMAVVQEAALIEAQNRIRQLSMQVQQLEAQLRQSRQPASGGGFFASLFGGAPRRQQASTLPPGWGPYGNPTNAGAAPQAYAPGMFAQRGSGFLGSALTTATGVAGGMLAVNAIEGLLSGHHDAGGLGAGLDGGGFGGAGSDAMSDPFGGMGTDAGSSFDANDFGNVDDAGWGDGDAGDFGGGDGGGWGDDSF